MTTVKRLVLAIAAMAGLIFAGPSTTPSLANPSPSASQAVCTGLLPTNGVGSITAAALRQCLDLVWTSITATPATTVIGHVVGWGDAAGTVLTDIGIPLGNVAGPGSSTAGNTACWNNAAGTLLKDCGGATNAITNTYAAASTDCRGVVQAGGTLDYTITVGATSGFTAGCQIRIINTDAANGKLLAVSGLTTRTLFPGQAITYQANSGNSAWLVSVEPGRWRPSSTANFYANSLTGNDVNTCLSAAAACSTIGHIQLVAGTWVDSNFFIANQSTPGIRINLADGTYNEAIHWPGYQVGQQGLQGWQLAGNCSAPGNVIIASPSSQPAIDVETEAILQIHGLTLAGTNATLLEANHGGIVNISGCSGGLSTPAVIFSAAGTQCHMFANNGGMIEVSTDIVVSGSAYCHFSAQGAGSQIVWNTGVSEYYSASVVYTFYANASYLGLIIAQNGLNIVLGGNTITATKYSCATNAVIEGNSTIPGTGGSALTGCQFH